MNLIFFFSDSHLAIALAQSRSIDNTICRNAEAPLALNGKRI